MSRDQTSSLQTRTRLYTHHSGVSLVCRFFSQSPSSVCSDSDQSFSAFPAKSKVIQALVSQVVACFRVGGVPACTLSYRLELLQRED